MLKHKIKQIACGGSFCIILTVDGIYSFGTNSSGQLGDGSQKSEQLAPVDISDKFQGEIVTQISCGTWHTLAATNKQSIFAFGGNSCGQLGDGTKQSK